MQARGEQGSCVPDPVHAGACHRDGAETCARKMQNRVVREIVDACACEVRTILCQQVVFLHDVLCLAQVT